MSGIQKRNVSARFRKKHEACVLKMKRQRIQRLWYRKDTTERRGKPAVASEDSSTAENVIKAVYATEAGGDKAGTDYRMLKIVKSSAKLNADQIDIEIYVSPASNGSFTYDALYIGRWDDETKEPLVMGEVDTELNLEKFAFSVPAEKNGQEVIFVTKKRKNTEVQFQ